MNDFNGTQQDEKRNFRDWINPLRLYDPRIPVGRLVFFWGLVIFPFMVMFVLLSAVIIIFETAFPNASSDYLGIIIYIFMFGWVAAAVAITRRRLFDLGMSQNWIWLAIFPIINLPLIFYLLLKPGPGASHAGV